MSQKKQLTGFVDVYAGIKNGSMSIIQFVDWLDFHYDKKKVVLNCNHKIHVGTCKNCKIKERKELRK